MFYVATLYKLEVSKSDCEWTVVPKACGIAGTESLAGSREVVFLSSLSDFTTGILLPRLSQGHGFWLGRAVR